MSLEELRLLQMEPVSDPESVTILSAYLGHAHGGTRNRDSAGSRENDRHGANREGRRESRSQTEGGMSENEAWSLPGLEKGASRDDIKMSYRRFMKHVHPDHGGTDYLAHKVTQAKELLLGLT
jgi:hypothetical protein